MSTVCTARASYKKIPGLLELTPTHLQWTQDGKKAPAVRVAHSEVSCALTVEVWDIRFTLSQHSSPQKKAPLKCASKLASRTIAMATISHSRPLWLPQNARHSRRSSRRSSAITVLRARQASCNLRRQVPPLLHLLLTVLPTVPRPPRRPAHQPLVPRPSRATEAHP